MADEKGNEFEKWPSRFLEPEQDDEGAKEVDYLEMLFEHSYPKGGAKEAKLSAPPATRPDLEKRIRELRDVEELARKEREKALDGILKALTEHRKGKKKRECRKAKPQPG